MGRRVDEGEVGVVGCAAVGAVYGAEGRRGEGV